MTLPSLSKTWQFDVNNTGGVNSSGTEDCQRTLFGIKESLKAFGSNPWTVWGSSNGATGFGNNDATDRWTDYTKLVWHTEGSENHSWIVLKQAGIGAGFQLCLNLGNYDRSKMNIVMSPSAGFNSDGDLQNRPTAADEVVVSLTSDGWGPANSAFTLKWHLMQSTDGECTRLIICRSSAVYGVWILDKPRDPITPWTNPCIGGVYGNGSGNTGKYAAWNDIATHMKARITGTMLLYLTSESVLNGMWPEIITVPDDLDGSWPMLPIGLACSVAPNRGRKGTVYDLWWGSTGVTNGTTYPDDGTHQFAQFDHLIFPWDGSLPLIA